MLAWERAAAGYWQNRAGVSGLAAQSSGWALCEHKDSRELRDRRWTHEPCGTHAAAAVSWDTEGAELCGRARCGTYCGIICGSSAGVWGSGSGRRRCAEVVALMWH